MNEVNKTLYIPLYGKSFVSRQGIILQDTKAEEIWNKEGFELKGKSKSKWLAYNMAMRAKVFDDWTESMTAQNPEAIVIHIGCGLDSRCFRVKRNYKLWLDCDLPEVIAVRKQYFKETPNYHMAELDATDTDAVKGLPDADAAVIVLEGISMYLANGELKALLRTLKDKYPKLNVLMDVYTEFGAKATKYKNPINDVGVTEVHGVDDIGKLLEGTGVRVVKEHSFTPDHLVSRLKNSERRFFKLMFREKTYSRMYRLYELEGVRPQE